VCDSFALRWASCNGHLPVVERLLQDVRVNPAARDNLAIRLASASGHLSVVERLSQDARVGNLLTDEQFRYYRKRAVTSLQVKSISPWEATRDDCE